MGLMDKILGRNKKPPVEKRTLKNLRVGDIVSYDLVDYSVVGLIQYEDSGYKWTAYQLEGDSERIWLAVEQDDTLEVSVFRPVKIDIGQQPPNKISFEGRTFFLDEAGMANIVKVEGEAGASTGQKIKYWEYEDEEGDYALSIELWGGDIEVSYGYYIHQRELSIMAGS